MYFYKNKQLASLKNILQNKLFNNKKFYYIFFINRG